jgi:two-component system, NarL family, response regulator LiaR
MSEITYQAHSRSDLIHTNFTVNIGLKNIHVLIVDDHAVVRKGMKALLREFEDITVVGEAANGPLALAMVERLNPDIVLLDLLMPGMDGIEVIKRIKASRPDQRFIVLTAYPGEDKCIEAIRAGAMGYLLKDSQPEDLVESIRTVSKGQPWLNPNVAWRMLQGSMSTPMTSSRPLEQILSERELEVLRLLTLGKTDQEMAQQLVLGEVTIRTHISRIISKMGLQNRVEAVLACLQAGFVLLQDTFPPNEDIGYFR